MTMRKLLILFISLSIFGAQPVNTANAEEGKADPKVNNCGKMGCNYFVGKFFMLGDVDDFSMENADRLPKPSKKDSIHSSIWQGGSVNFILATTDGKLPLGEFKAVIQGDGATFGSAPFEGVTFSEDRKTIYIAYTKPEYKIAPNGFFQIFAKKTGKISLTSYSKISEGVYSDTPTDVGEIIVSPKSLLKAKTSITCFKGKVSKKVIALNPICPSGYKPR